MSTKLDQMPQLLPLVAIVLLTCVAIVAWEASQDDPGFERVRNGMTKEEAIAAMGRPPDKWLPLPYRRVSALPVPWPPPDWAGVVHLGWGPDEGECAWVWLDSSGRVEGKDWVYYGPIEVKERPSYYEGPSIWERLRCWLKM